MVSSNAFHAENADNRFYFLKVSPELTHVVIPNPPSTSVHLHAQLYMYSSQHCCMHYSMQIIDLLMQVPLWNCDELPWADQWG